MSDNHGPSDGTPHIKVTVYSTPCESEEWPSIDNFNVFQYPGRNRPSILKEYLDEARREPERMVYLSSAAAVGRSALIFPVNGTLAATISILDSVFRFQCSAGRTERYITPGGADNRYCRIIVAD
ncbi:hypothetical protein F9877_03400 [Morganella morganii]|uniref:hypothetical protein n=1 Tax=Morganella morganii TaxID=582 RepID=UPI0015F600BB|nr:hypothetical protein [Morganella morganii]MBA5820398.1 hypothetical protein [Morganella morganii]HDU8545964.1 hypothetical protein [Morganella morganii]